MDPSPDSTPNFKQGQKRIWIAAGVIVVVAIAVVLGLSGVFEGKRSRMVVDMPSNKEGGTGCPCGCDRSEAMSVELRTRAPSEALGAIDESLATIAEREAAGYVTERMVQHRLRLLELAREISPSESLRTFTREAPFAIAPAGNPSSASDATLRAKMELIVHGDTIEWVEDRQKPLAACFLLRMDVENRTERTRRVEKPEIVAGTSLPISRWYLRGSDGAPWDGVLQAGETRSIQVIGYVGRSLAPGARVDATIRFESLSLRAATRARAKWNAS